GNSESIVTYFSAMDKNELWQAVLAKMELSVSRPNFVTWFRGTGIMDVQSGTATVYVPSNFIKEWLQNKYHKPILHALREVSTDIRDVNYIIAKPSGMQAAGIHRDIQKKRSPAFNQLPPDAFAIKELTVNPETNLNRRYTFETFVV